MDETVTSTGTGRGTDAVHARVHAILRNHLIAGHYSRGTRLVVRDLARSLGVSPTPVREALRQLASEGAVEILGTGTARVPIMTRASYRELGEARIALECLAARRSVAKVREEDLSRIADAAAEYAAVMAGWDPTRVVATDHAFHRALYEPGSEGVLLPLIEAMQVRSGPVLRELVAFYRTPREDLHAAALSALRAGDADGVAAAVAADIRRATDFILENAAFEVDG